MPDSDSVSPLTRRDWLLAGSSLLLSAHPRCWAQDTLPEKKTEQPALHIVGVSEKQQPVDIECELVTEAQDGGLLVRSRDNRLWTMTPRQITSREPASESFRLYTPEELKRQLQHEFPPPFRVVEKGKYLFCTDVNSRFLDRCTDLFLRLRKAFTTHCEKLKLPIVEPPQGLPVVIFAEMQDYRSYATREFDALIAQTTGYYSVMHNRIVLYDITAGAKEAVPLDRLAEQVATIVHEATHQLAFNCGVQQRLADNPLWLTEGLAMYFETPDLESRSGWKNVGAFNTPRARDLFREFEEHPNLSLATFIASDAVFHEPRREAGAYGLAWGLFYFLMKQKPAAMVQFLTGVSRKPVLVWDTPEQRVKEFEAAFGDVGEVSRQSAKFFERLGRKL